MIYISIPQETPKKKESTSFQIELKSQQLNTNNSNNFHQTSNPTESVLQNVIVELSKTSNISDSNVLVENIPDENNDINTNTESIYSSSQPIEFCSKDDFEDENDYFINVIDLLLTTIQKHKSNK